MYTARSGSCHAAEAFASQAETESSAVIYDYDPDYVDRKYELLSLKVIHRRRRTGFEETKDFPIRVNDLVAGRYQVTAWCLSSFLRENKCIVSKPYTFIAAVCVICTADAAYKHDYVSCNHYVSNMLSQCSSCRQQTAHHQP